MSVIGILFLFTTSLPFMAVILISFFLSCFLTDIKMKLLLLLQVLETLLLSSQAVTFDETSGVRHLIASSHMACSQTQLFIYYYEVTVRSGTRGR